MKKKKNGKANEGITLLLLLGFCLCIIWLVKYGVDTARAARQLEEVKDVYVTEEVDSGDMEESTTEQETTNGIQEEETTKEAFLKTYGVPEKSIDFAALQEKENSDIYAWITIPDTQIDYPILQHPTDPNHYLNYNMDGTKGYPGCIYTELYNSTKWDDPNTVIYGHNMKNGSMFAGLHYFEDAEFFQQHSYVYIYSPEAIYVYQIFAAYEFSNAHLLLGFDIGDPESFGQYLAGIRQNEGMNHNFNQEIEVTAQSKIITLETCIANKPDKRYLVQAVLIATGEA